MNELQDFQAIFEQIGKIGGSTKKKNSHKINRLFCIDSKFRPLTPVTPKRARELIEKGEATIFRLYPLTLILKKEINKKEISQKSIILSIDDFTKQEQKGLRLKIDPGSRTTGFAILLNGLFIWGMNLTHRIGIVDKLTTRRQCRRGRRNRKTRYRKPRFMNRVGTKKKGWLPPSKMAVINNIINWTKKIMRFCPISAIDVEHVKFDTQKMENPEIQGVEYQQGTLMGFEVRQYLLEKFEHRCFYCGTKNTKLAVEHVFPKAKGGSNRVDNLTVACVECNNKKGTKKIEEFLKDPEKVKKLKERLKGTLKDAAKVNAIRNRLVEDLKALDLNVYCWSGGQTKYNRTSQRFPKDHWLDAACLGISGNKIKIDTNFDEEQNKFIPTFSPLLVKATGRGSRVLITLEDKGDKDYEPEEVVFVGKRKAQRKRKDKRTKFEGIKPAPGFPKMIPLKIDGKPLILDRFSEEYPPERQRKIDGKYHIYTPVAPKRLVSRFGFKTGDIVRAKYTGKCEDLQGLPKTNEEIVPNIDKKVLEKGNWKANNKEGIILKGRIGINSSGSFRIITNLTSKSVSVNWKNCEVIHRKDGYQYE